MARIVFVYGLISGLVVIGGIIATVVLNGDTPHGNVWLGYLIMLLGLSLVLVGVKQYRDQVRGGVIGFLPALGVGLAIAVLASLAYVAAWEAYLAATDYAFMDQYVSATLQARRAEGLTGEAYKALERDLAEMAVNYRSPVFRLPMTFIEIFPVGVLVALVSAGLLRNSRFLPAKSRS
ncbi:MAG: DUF4199 domain-containing protein [Phenylobacterium sp.]|uniref:DUF4199 domain-containing protein n=1 Tax=Phenylobacterium sp. TaxID=1871053 RepID=UPI001A63FD0B|nr:DUF4199 domain-containing protein [Phenylobacterium sp.]MBL8773221.1 DUF4199 domain-containing protein [Phenylobacterium sp.]